MKKNILLLFSSLLLFMAADVQAEQPHDKECCHVDAMYFYAKALGGANFLQSTTIEENKTSYKPGYVFAGTFGYCYRYGLCLEAEYAFRRNGISKIHFFGEGSSKNGYFQTSSYMANLVWGYPTWGCAFWKIQPFFGAGVGYDIQQMRSSNSRIVFHQKWNHFSWQLMGGFAYPIFRNTELTLEYKFHQGGSHFNNNSIGVGLVYKFGFIRK